jgi:hypothetical protein
VIVRAAATRAAIALGISACAAVSVPARADDAPPVNRFSVGLAEGPMISFQASADGSPVAEPAGQTANAIVALGADRSVARWLALGFEARGGSWNSAWSAAAGYDSEHERMLFDLDAVMRLRSPPVSLFPKRLVFSLSPSVGFTWPFAPARHTRAVNESWQPLGGGGNLGIELTAETWFAHPPSRWKMGLAAGFGYTRHWFSLDGELTPISDPGATVSARYRYVADQLMIKLAFLTGF